MPLPAQIFSYAYWLNTTDPESGLRVPGLGSHRFHLFHRPARLRAMELTREPPREDGGAWSGRPERVVIEGYADDTSPGRVLFDGSLPWDSSYKCRLEFPDVPLLAVSQRCHWAQRQSSRTSWSGTRRNTPFRPNIFDGTNLQWRPSNEFPCPRTARTARARERKNSPGEHRRRSDRIIRRHVRPLPQPVPPHRLLARPATHRLLPLGTASAPAASKKTSSSIRGTGFADAPRQAARGARGTAFELPPMLWTGTVEVDGRRARYRGLRSLAGLHDGRRV